MAPNATAPAQPSVFDKAEVKALGTFHNLTPRLALLLVEINPILPLPLFLELETEIYNRIRTPALGATGSTNSQLPTLN